MSAFASPLPIAVITRMLGLADEPDRLRRVGAILASALDGVHSLRHARQLFVADREMRASFDALLDRAAREPGDDLTSALVAQQGERITSAELSSLVGLLLLAGFETTVNAIGNGVRALLTNPEQWQLLVQDPSARRMWPRRCCGTTRPSSRPPGCCCPRPIRSSLPVSGSGRVSGLS